MGQSGEKWGKMDKKSKKWSQVVTSGFMRLNVVLCG